MVGGRAAAGLRLAARRLSTRMDNKALNKALLCKAVFVDLQALRIEPGEEPHHEVPSSAQSWYSKSRLGAPVAELTLDTLDTLLTHELRDAARERGVDSIGPRQVIVERLRAQLEEAAAQAPAQPREEHGHAAEAGDGGGVDEGGSIRDKYAGKLSLLKAKAAQAKRPGTPPSGGSGGSGGGGGWIVQPGATQLVHYLDNRGITRAVVLRPPRRAPRAPEDDARPEAEDEEAARAALAADAAEVLRQMAVSPFACTHAGAGVDELAELAARLELDLRSVLLLSSDLDTIAAARRAHMLTCYLRKSYGGAASRDSGLRGVSPDFTVRSLPEVAAAVDQLNGVSFRVVPTG